MKRISICILLLSLFTSGTIKAQSLPNYSFESWASDTNYLDLTVVVSLRDTAYTVDPISWTTSNEVTDGNILNHKRLCTRDTTVYYTGLSSIKITSDSISATTPVGTLKFISPGFAISGDFKINLSDFAGRTGAFNPAYTPGAGLPIARRMGKVGGYLKSIPVGGDSTAVIALLRKGATLVAQATYYRTTTDAAFTYFEAPFIYQSCLIPDTMVVLIASGNPYTLNNFFINGQPTGLHKGTTIYADSIFVSDTASVFSIPPFAIMDSAHTTTAIPVTIHVTANDQDCYGRAWTVAILTMPHHGTVAIVGDSAIYTPTVGYVGLDTFSYTLTTGSQSATAIVKVSVTPNVGIKDPTALADIKVYPNPAHNALFISSSNTMAKQMRIYDLIGNVVKTETVTTEIAKIDLAHFTTGLYLLQVSSIDGNTLLNTKFSVVR